MRISAMGREVELIDVIFAVFLVASLIWQNGYLSQLKQIPSPMYGGDYYNGLGGVNHILSGGNLLESAQMVGEPPWVPWMYHLSVAAFSIISGMDPMHALIYFSFVIQIFTLITVYLLAARVAGRKDVALLSSVLMLLSFPVFKYSDFATVLVVPLFTLALAVFMERPDRKNALVAGLAMAFMGLSNTQAFFVGIMMFGIAGIFLLYPKL
ncbi:glycosyltransferase family 39 protein, partial [Candidatus Micrarchaeota archaeon]|nr:glycosyltransferase family 39 protein [Candidatus Micrarchaeota archaeon]